MDLRHPVYMVTDDSFWSGCEDYAFGYEACRESRERQIYAGVHQWFHYFDATNRPRVVIVHTVDELPLYMFNDVIHLQIQKGACGGKGFAACYNWEPFSYPKIVFESSNQIIPRIVAHEFGHTLDRDDNDVPAGTDSVMSYEHPTFVLPLDVKMMCRLHHECRMVRRKIPNN